MSTLLEVKNLSVAFEQEHASVEVVHDISFSVNAGETFALVGESGSGKSVTALSILGLLPAYAHYPSGQILFENQDLLTLSEKALRPIRGDRIGVIFQEPMTALNPLHTIEKQIGEILSLHQGLRNRGLRTAILDLLEQVRIPDPESRLKSFPHELSGGQRQRVMIAMALANKPNILIADEPTTALDVTVQKDIMDLLVELKNSANMAMLIITHDLGIVRYYSDRVAVMKEGRIIETNSTTALFTTPHADYTRELIHSEPRGGPVALDSDSDSDSDSDPNLERETLLSCQQLSVRFPLEKPFLFGKPKRWLTAVDNISISLKRGTTLGVVGESGSGKSTLALALLRLTESSGDITFLENQLNVLNQKMIRPLRKNMQIVFQDPFASLSPRLTVAQIIAEGLSFLEELTPEDEETKLIAVMEEVGLDPKVRHRYPHEFSGGQRQRIAIARALILNPELLYLDEPTSALDRAIQVQILDLLRDLQQKRGLSYLFISHDLHAVKAISHEILVMRHGKIIEQGSGEKIFNQPENIYTKELLAASLRA